MSDPTCQHAWTFRRGRLTLHQLLAVEGYSHKQAHCSCGWSGRAWPSVYGFLVGTRMTRAAKREWRAHRDDPAA